MGIATSQADGVSSPATWNFSKVDNIITINGVAGDLPAEYILLVDSLNEILAVKTNDGVTHAYVNTNNDTTTVGGSPFTGTASELKTLLLSDLFSGATDGNMLLSFRDVLDVNPDLNDHNTVIRLGEYNLEFSSGDPDGQLESAFINFKKEGFRSYTQNEDATQFMVFEVYRGAPFGVKIQIGEGEDYTEYLFTAAGLKIDNLSGASGSFTSQDGKTITVTKGIITSIVEP